MNFLYPLGFLGLIGVIIIIVLYLIKNKYREQTIASTYLWTLSEQFLKKKRPLKKINNLLPLILQILVVCLLTIALVNPTFTIQGKADNICFILDASGSMNMRYHDSTRFELAKDKIYDIVNSSYTGSNYTLVLSGVEPQIVFEKETNKQYIFEAIKNLEVEQCSSNIDEALELVQNFYNKNGITKTYLLSDHFYNEISNIEVINFATEELNYSIIDSRYTIKSNLINVYADIIAYGKDATANLTVLIDNQEQIKEEISLEKNIEENLKYEIPYKDFNKITIRINNHDLLSLDNENILYNSAKAERSNILLVSSSPFYLKSILQAIGCKVTIIEPKGYQNQLDYDIYIFDSYTPTSLPLKGAIWLINTSQNIPNSGFVVQDEIALDNGGVMKYENDDSYLYNKLTKNIKNNSISFNHYMKYGIYRDFTTILSYQRSPLVFAGYNDNGNREIVFAFDFHNSDLPLLYDYVVLINNFINYSFPQTIESNYYTVGDNLDINWVDDYDYIKITSPQGKITYLEQSIDSVYFLNEVGTYTCETSFEGTTKNYTIYSCFDNEESNSLITSASISLDVNQNNIVINAIYDKIYIYIIILLVFFVLDWGLYAYEKH